MAGLSSGVGQRSGVTGLSRNIRAAGALTGTAGRNSTFGRPVLRDFPSITDYGAVADGQVSIQGAITSGTNQLRVLAGSLLSTQVPAGTPVWVNGAGVAGAVLHTTIQSVNTSTQTATLAANASTTISSGGVFAYGTPNGAAIQTAINDTVGSQYQLQVPGTPSGAFVVDTTLNFDALENTQQGFRFWGQGSGNTSQMPVSGTSKLINVSGAALFKAVSPTATMSGLRIDGLYMALAVALPAGDVDEAWMIHLDYVVQGLHLEDLIVMGNNLTCNGVLHVNHATGQWLIDRVRVSRVPGVGFQIGTQARTGNYGTFAATQGGNGTLANCSVFTGQSKGFYLLGSQLGTTLQSCKVVGSDYTIGYHLESGSYACNIEACHSEGPPIGYQVDSGAVGNRIHGFSHGNNLGTSVLNGGQSTKIHLVSVSIPGATTQFITKYGCRMTATATNSHALVDYYGNLPSDAPIWFYRDDSTAGNNTFGTGVGEQITLASMSAPVAVDNVANTTEATAVTVLVNSGDMVDAPSGASATLAAGGTLTVATPYFYTLEFVSPDSNTPTLLSAASTEVTVTPTTGNQSTALAWAPVPNCQTRIYRSTTSGVGTYGGTSLLGTAAINVGTFTDTGTATGAGGPNAGAGTAVGVYVPGGRTLMEFFCPGITPGTTKTLTLVYFVNGVAQGQSAPLVSGSPVYFRHLHTNFSGGSYNKFEIRAFVPNTSTGPGSVLAGTGATGTLVSGYLRVTRA